MKRKTIALIGVALLVAVAVAGLAAQDSAEGAEATTSTEGDNQETRDKIDRVAYPEDGVVCYVMDEEGAMGSGAGWESGISCVPMNDTLLEDEDEF